MRDAYERAHGHQPDAKWVRGMEREIESRAKRLDHKKKRESVYQVRNKKPTRTE